jgi:hypothetical protein
MLCVSAVVGQETRPLVWVSLAWRNPAACSAVTTGPAVTVDQTPARHKGLVVAAMLCRP